MQSDAESQDAAEVVRRQLDAYSARDIDAFVVRWAHNAEILLWPNFVICTGAAEIRSRRIERFREPDAKACLISRVAQAGSPSTSAADGEWKMGFRVNYNCTLCAADAEALHPRDARLPPRLLLFELIVRGTITAPPC